MTLAYVVVVVGAALIGWLYGVSHAKTGNESEDIYNKGREQSNQDAIRDIINEYEKLVDKYDSALRFGCKEYEKISNKDREKNYFSWLNQENMQ